MYNAPSVAYPVGRCAFERWLYIAFMIATCGVWFAWAIVQPRSVWLFVGLGCVLGAALWGLRVLQLPLATLYWNGNVWLLHEENSKHGSDQLGQPHVCMDFQHILLLHWQPLSKPHNVVTRWLWLNRSTQPARWQDLRRAVYDRAYLS
jgi:hypothetical protein